MSVSNEFIENVNSGDVSNVRSALLNYIFIDPTFGAFDEALRFAKQKLPVFEEHDGKTFELDESKWDEDYYGSLCTGLLMNFSQERLKHLRDVAAKVVINAPKSKSQGSTVKHSNKHSRTGTRTLEERPVTPNEEDMHGKTDAKKNWKPSAGSQRKLSTGSRTQSPNESTSNVGTALIVGGLAVAATGAALLITEQVTTVAGGVGCGVMIGLGAASVVGGVIQKLS